MVLEPDDGAELFRFLNDVADQAFFTAYGLSVKDTNTVEGDAADGFELSTEELVKTADDQHGGATFCQHTQGFSVGEQVVLNHGLA